MINLLNALCAFVVSSMFALSCNTFKEETESVVKPTQSVIFLNNSDRSLMVDFSDLCTSSCLSLIQDHLDSLSVPTGQWVSSTSYDSSFSNLILNGNYANSILYLRVNSSRNISFSTSANGTSSGSHPAMSLFISYNYQGNSFFGGALYNNTKAYLFIKAPSDMSANNIQSKLYKLFYDRYFDEQRDVYTEGYDTGYVDGRQSRDSDVINARNEGYYQGLSEGQSQDTNIATIFSGILEVGLLPINVFLAMFNYEIFGVNVAGMVSALLTIAIVVIVIKSITGGGNGASKND